MRITIRGTLYSEISNQITLYITAYKADKKTINYNFYNSGWEVNSSNNTWEMNISKINEHTFFELSPCLKNNYFINNSQVIISKIEFIQ